MGSHLCRILSDRSMCGSHYHESVFSYHYLAFRIRQNEKKSRVRKETKEFAEKQELEFSDAPSMDESTEPEDLQQATDSVSGAGDEWELEEKEQEDDSEQGDIHV